MRLRLAFSIATAVRPDVLVVDGNPLEGLDCLAEPEKHLDVIVRGGEVIVDDTDGTGDACAGDGAPV